MKQAFPRGTRRLVASFLSLGVVMAVVSPARADDIKVPDTEDDAYRIPDTPAGQPEPRPPMPLLSDDRADILTARIETAPPPPGTQGAYKVSVTVPAPDKRYNYIVGARFGRDCWVFHYLTAGETRPALTACNSKPAGKISGSPVAITGNTIFATFSFRRFLLPSQLKNDPVLGPFFVITCPITGTSWACEDDTLLDFAYSEGNFSV